jgi:hypothetical protein
MAVQSGWQLGSLPSGSTNSIQSCDLVLLELMKTKDSWSVNSHVMAWKPIAVLSRSLTREQRSLLPLGHVQETPETGTGQKHSSID